jgi:serine/threonine protein kinase
MPLSPGDRLGPYEILSPLGAGGMGEVYKALDTRLDRTVAVKVLPKFIADRDDLRARFEREARAVASLKHPNICVLHDIGKQDGIDFMVLEHLEGETLAARVSKGPLPLDQVLKYASQIADALDRAHRSNVNHRDVKPANIMVTRDGIKVLDFGLAKTVPRVVGPDDVTRMPDAMTVEGTMLGTPQYMAPEQYEGKEADARSDIFAFGCVVYEMVTGKRCFEGKTRASLIAAVLGGEPVPMSAVVPVTPPALERLVKRCLEKDPEDRYQSMRDVVLELRSIPVGQVSDLPGLNQIPAASKLPWALFAAMTLIAVVASVLYFRAGATTAPETRVDIVTPATADPTSFALSPDGRRIAFVASGDGASRLWVRSLDSTSAQALPGTEGALSPFWSPDSRSLGFFANLKLKRIDLGGGQPQTLADVAAVATQGAWSEEGVILFAQSPGTPLSRIPASGGQVVAATKRGNGQVGHRVPRFLPGGRQFLFVSVGAGLAQALWLGSLDGSEPRRIATLTPGTESAAEYLAPGWLVRVRQTVLTAQRFDAGRGQLSGDPVTLAQAVGVDPNTLAGSFSVSPAGVIAWRSGGGGDRRQLIWFNRSGQNVGTFGGPDEFNTRYPELSPDAKRVAITRGPTGSADIWIEEGTRASRFTFGQGARVLAVSNLMQKSQV